jgi:Tol biopolymer transport system component
MTDADGRQPRQLTTFENAATMPGRGSSRDGQEIAVMSGKDGNLDIYVVNLGSGRSRRLTQAPSNEGGPSWSADGRWVYFGSNRGGSRELWKLPSGGGEAIQVTRNGGTLAREWGDSLYLTKSNPFGGPPGLWRMPLGGGDEVRLLDFVLSYNWDLFERGICYLNFAADPGPVVELYEFDTGRVSPIIVLDEDTIPYGLSVSPDGRWILFVKREEQSDLMLVESFH